MTTPTQRDYAMNRIVGSVAAAAVLMLSPSQIVAQRTLSAPTVTLDHEFTGIDGVRELRDGRVVVLDASDRAMYIINLTTKSVKSIGRDGDGPGEFRLPRAFLPIGGDTTLVHDMARFGKLLVVTPAGEMGDFVSTQDNALSTRPFIVGAVDAAGRFYENSYSGDSNSIVRWDRARGRRDTLARISMKAVSPLLRPRPSNARGGEESSGGPPPPFFTVSQWAVSADGRLAIVTPEPYRVTLVSPTGVRIQGQPIPVAAIPVGNREKTEYRIERERPVPTISVSNGVQTTSYQKPRYTEPAEWPARMPAFLLDAVSFATDGMLWVQRATRAGAPRLYDVFDAKATRAYQVELPANTKLVGFGAGTVYLARVDDDGLHYLQQYRMPK